MNEFQMLMLGLVAFVAGLVGSWIGIGGGIIIIPALVLSGMDMKIAISSSLLAIVASSSAASISYVKNKLSDLRLAILLEPGTVLGALLGAVTASTVSSQALQIIFLIFLIVVFVMIVSRNAFLKKSELLNESKGPPYKNIFLGVNLSVVAGFFSGLLGVGGGIFKVPLMHLLMGVPFRVAAATSNLMIGVTASAGAWVFWINDEINALVAAPVVLGVVLGASLGAKTIQYVSVEFTKKVFLFVLIVMFSQMFYRLIRS